METGAQEALTFVLSEAIIDAARCVILALDTTGRVIRWNRAAAELTGIGAAAIRGRLFSEMVIYPEDQDRWNQAFAQFLSEKKSNLFESRWKINEKGFASVTCSCAAVHDTQGGIQYVVCTAKESIAQAAMSDRIAEFHDISRFVHDTITQDLVALSFQLSMLEDATDEVFSTRTTDASACAFPSMRTTDLSAGALPSTRTTDLSACALSFREQVRDALQMVERCCRHMRVIGSLLASPSLDGITLEAGIEQHAAFLREEAGVDISLDLDPVGNEVAPEAQLLMFAFVKSWLGRGVWSRTQPRMSIRLRSPQSGGVLLGMEMTPPAVLISMQGWSVVHERAQALGGKVFIAGDTDRIVASMSFPGRAKA